jgi:hypothetical protein
MSDDTAGPHVPARRFGERITTEVAAWTHVRVHSHRSGGVAFRVRGREIGHLHGDRCVDLRFPAREARALVAAGRAFVHPVMPGSGWVSHPMRNEHDLPAVLALLRRNYQRLCGRHADRPDRHVGGSTQLVDDRFGGELPA